MSQKKSISNSEAAEVVKKETNLCQQMYFTTNDHEAVIVLITETSPYNNGPIKYGLNKK